MLSNSRNAFCWDKAQVEMAPDRMEGQKLNPSSINLKLQPLSVKTSLIRMLHYHGRETCEWSVRLHG